MSRLLPGPTRQCPVLGAKADQIRNFSYSHMCFMLSVEPVASVLAAGSSLRYDVVTHAREGLHEDDCNLAQRFGQR